MKNRFVSGLILVSIIICTILLLIVLYGSMRYWSNTFVNTVPTFEKLYLGGILIAIVSGAMYFLKLFINTMGDTIKSFRHE